MNKKIFTTILGIVVLLSGCNDDPTMPEIKIPTENEAIIQVNGTGNVGYISVEATGEWTASVIEEDADWLYIDTNEGSNCGNILYSADANRESVNRSATIRVANETQSVDYKITQNPAPDNAASDAKYVNDYIGRGMTHLKKGDQNDLVDFIGVSNIVNFRNLGDEELQELDEIVIENNSPTKTFTFKDLNEYQISDRKIEADLSVDISYGLFKLGLSGHFNMYGAQRDTTRCFGAIASVPSKIIELNYAQLIEYAQDEDYKDIRHLIFSSAFLNCLKGIEDTVAGGTTNWHETDSKSKTLKKNLDKLNRNFGPLMVYRVTKGGSVDIDFRVQSMAAEDSLNIRGKLNTSFSSLFSLKVEASAEYLNKNKSFMKGSTLVTTISGGRQNETNELVKQLATLVSPKSESSESESSDTPSFDTAKIIESISKWSDSLDPEVCIPYRCSVVGIWELFSDDAADVIKEYMKEKYSNTKDTEGKVIYPYLYDIEAIIDAD